MVRNPSKSPKNLLLNKIAIISLSIIQITFGVLAIIGNSIVIGYKHSKPDLPEFSTLYDSGFWCGLSFILIGSFGIKVSIEKTNNYVSTQENPI